MGAATHAPHHYTGRPYAARCAREVDATGRSWLECWYHDADGQEHAVRTVIPDGVGECGTKLLLRSEMRQQERRVEFADGDPMTLPSVVVWGTHVLPVPWSHPGARPDRIIAAAQAALTHTTLRPATTLRLSPEAARSLAENDRMPDELRYTDPSTCVEVPGHSALLPSWYSGLHVEIAEDGAVPSGAAWLVATVPEVWREEWVWQIAGCAPSDGLTHA